MPRRKKERLTFGELSSASNNGGVATLEELPEGAVPVEIESNEVQEVSFRDRLREKLASFGSEENNLSQDANEPATKRGRKPKGKPSDAEADFSTLVSSLFIIIVAAWKAPEDIKPNDDEINGVSYRVSRIILRHVDITGAMTADALDLIGVIAIGASWYSRVAPVLKQINGTRAATPHAQYNQVEGNEEQPQDTRPITPLEQIDPNAGNWLRRAAAGA